MNGAELPDGTVLKVQPASSEHKRKAPQNHASTVPAELEVTTNNGEAEATGKMEVEQEEELDDFFASLE